MRCTLPVIVSTVIVSPTANGLSRTIASAAKRSPRMFWTASAIATPLMPSPAISVVM